MNFTHIFEMPNNRFHSCENFWSSVFSVQLMQMSRRTQGVSIPLKTFHRDSLGWNYKEAGALSINTQLDITNVIVDGKMKTDFIKGVPVPEKYNDLRPDITILQPENRCILIETKTVGSKISDKELWYTDFIKYCKKQNITCEVYILISAGFEDCSTWDRLHDNGDWEGPQKIILWEEFAKEALKLSEPSILEGICPDLEQYCNIPLNG